MVMPPYLHGRRIDQGGNQQEASNKSACRLFMADSCFGFVFDPDDGGDTLLRKVIGLLTNYRALQPRENLKKIILRKEVNMTPIKISSKRR
jgi:hypothetical protein